MFVYKSKRDFDIETAIKKKKELHIKLFGASDERPTGKMGNLTLSVDLNCQNKRSERSLIVGNFVPFENPFWKYGFSVKCFLFYSFILLFFFLFSCSLFYRMALTLSALHPLQTWCCMRAHRRSFQKNSEHIHHITEHTTTAVCNPGNNARD